MEELLYTETAATTAKKVEHFIDFNLVLFYTFLTIIFSVMLTFERSRKYITRKITRLNKIKTLTKVAAQVAVRSSKKTASTTKKTLYNVLLTTRNSTVSRTTSGVKRIGGKLLNYRRLITSTSSTTTAAAAGQSTPRATTINRLNGTLSSTVSTIRRSSSYLLHRTNKIRLSLLDKRVKLRTSHRIYNSKVKLYKKLPLRSMSRIWGVVNAIDLPVWLRKPVYLLYAWLFGCNLNEMDIEDLQYYKNLSEFFRRKLKPDARTVDKTSTLISPCDGKVLHFGKVDDKGYLEQVKGVTYSLKGFLGEQSWKAAASNKKQVVESSHGESDTNSYQSSLKQKQDTELYHCIIYLAPGDYHRYHSPTDWNVYYRRHFPGELFSVNPSVARWLQGLFSLNERVVYYGDWKHGFFSMTPVGATNVGSIRVYFDSALETNLKPREMNGLKLEKDFRLGEKLNDNGVKIGRGDYFGEFNLGSTIVLIFEAPKNFEFSIKQNQKVKFGQSLGTLMRP